VGAGKAPEAETPGGSQESGVGSRGLGKEDVWKPEAAADMQPPTAEGAIATETAPTNGAALESSAPEKPPVVPLFVPRPPVAPKAPAWGKLTITLEQSDFDILDRFHVSAREAGLKLRRGGNPSLFIRAALRAFEEQSEERPDLWAERLVGVMARDGA